MTVWMTLDDVFDLDDGLDYIGRRGDVLDDGIG